MQACEMCTSRIHGIIIGVSHIEVEETETRVSKSQPINIGGCFWRLDMLK